MAHGTTIGEKGVSYWLGTDGRQTDGTTDLMRWSINGNTNNDFEHDMIAGEWYHIVATYDGSNCNVYINGVEKAGNFSQSGIINNQSGSKIGLIGNGGRHFGIEGTGYVIHPSHVTYGIKISENNIIIDGIEIYDGDAIAFFGVFLNLGPINTIIKNCIIHGVYGTSMRVGIDDRSAGPTYCYNNILYDIGDIESAGTGIRSFEATNILYAYNNTVVNIFGSGIYAHQGTVFAKNNLVADCSLANFNTNTGSFDSTSDYNASADGTNTGGSNDRINQTFSFVNDRSGEGEGNPSTEVIDYHLAWNDAGAKNHGVSLMHDSNLQFFTDIDGDIRGEDNPSGGEWDIGADEYIAP